MKSHVVKTAASLVTFLGACATPLVSVAQTYQIEANAEMGIRSFDFDRGGSGDGNIINLGARYYLAPVETVGPWAESAFLQKSTSAGIALFRTGDNFDSNTDFAIDLFLVTADNLILGGQLGSNDATNIGAFGGLYLDDRTTAIASISLGDIDSIGGEYKTIMQLASGNDLTAEANIALVNAGDSGIAIGGSATYYLSDQLGVSGGLGLETFGNEEISLEVGAKYFLSETLAVGGDLSLAFGDFLDTTSITIGAIGRF